MKRILILTISLAIVTSCTIEKYGSTETLLVNETDYPIQIVAYKGGLEYEKRSISSKQSLVVLKMHVKGKTIYPNYGTMLQPYDSVVVIYNNTERITHLRFDSQNNKGIPFASNRNLTNPENYLKVITKETKYSISGYHTYTFTEQDYLDASQ